MILRIIMFAMFLTGSFMTLRVVTSLDALTHGAIPAQVGVMMALLHLFPVFLAIPCGRWVDRIGFQRPVWLNAFLLLAAAAVPVLAPVMLPVFASGMYRLYLACILAGLASMVLAIVSNYLVGLCSEPSSRTKYFAWLTMGNSVAGLSTPILSGHLIDGLGYWAAYAAAAAMVVVGLVMYLLSLRQLKTIALPKPKRYSKRAWDLLRDPRLRRVLIVSSIVSMAWDLETFMFPVYGKGVGLSATEIGWLVGTFYAATFFVRMLQSTLSRFLREWQCLTMCLVLTCIGYVLFANFTTLWPLLGIAVVLGCGLGVANPSIMSLIQTCAPAGRAGEAFGIRSMIANATHFALPMAYGTILAALSVASLFYMTAGMMAFGGTLAWQGMREEARSRRSETDT